MNDGGERPPSLKMQGLQREGYLAAFMWPQGLLEERSVMHISLQTQPQERAGRAGGLGETKSVLDKRTLCEQHRPSCSALHAPATAPEGGKTSHPDGVRGIFCSGEKTMFLCNRLYLK